MMRIRPDPDPENWIADILLTSSSVARSRRRTSLSSRRAAGGISRSSCCGLEYTPAQPRGRINKQQSLEIQIRIDIWALLNPNPDPEAMEMTKSHQKTFAPSKDWYVL
jgi:hypothetical protein